jgi:hypothetical protein
MRSRAVKARRVTEITMQTDEAFAIRRRAGSVTAVCAQCGSGMPMLVPEEAAVLFGVAVRAVYRELETGRLHFQETSTGSVLVFLDSLRKIASGFLRNSSSQINNNKEIKS